MLLYFHIPYCDSKCFYCAFNSYTDQNESKEIYMKALKTQLLYELELFGVKEKEIESLFIGGGTPSTVRADLYQPVFELLSPYLSKGAEITTEANPNSASKEWLEGMKALGVNRVSFGVQSFDDEKLKMLNRAHSSKDAVDAITRAKETGFENISLDLIYNWKKDSQTTLLRDINIAKALPIDHLSAYELTIEKGTVFAKSPNEAKDDEELARFITKKIESLGFKQYEISNFGKPCRHNIGYWKLKDYMGVGAGAVGFKKNERYYPSVSIESYIKNPQKRRVERLNSDDLQTEKIFLGMRSIVGVEKSILDKDMLKRADILVNEGKIELRNDRYFNKDYFLADEITLYIKG